MFEARLRTDVPREPVSGAHTGLSRVEPANVGPEGPFWDKALITLAMRHSSYTYDPAPSMCAIARTTDESEQKFVYRGPRSVAKKQGVPWAR